MYCLGANVYCHRVTTQLQLTNISYHIISYIPPFVPSTREINPVHEFLSYLFKTHLNTILLSLSRSTMWSLSFTPPLPNQNLVMVRLAFRNSKSRDNNRLNEPEPLRSACYFSVCFTFNLNDYIREIRVSWLDIWNVRSLIVGYCILYAPSSSMKPSALIENSDTHLSIRMASYPFERTLN